MREIAERLAAWHAAGQPYAVASVVGVSGSAPREPGAALAVSADGEAVGSVSGGCVEGAVYELCREALATGRPRLERFGYSDEDAFAVGLTCGGVIDVFVQPVRPARPARPGTPPPAGRARGGTPRPGTARGDGLGAFLTALGAGRPVALVRVVEAPPALAGLVGRALAVTTGDGPDARVAGRLGPGAAPELEAAAAAQARAMLDAGRTGRLVLAPDGSPCGPGGEVAAAGRDGIALFVEAYAPRPRMLVFGAIDFAAAVARVGSFLGYRVTVCDARPVFATERRFPAADEVVVDWPHRYLEREQRAGRLDGRTVVCVLTHDPKFDIPLLERALRLPLGYVGAMGSRRTHRDRQARLRETGLTAAQIERLRSPIGLDLGARTPEETAVAVAAEIVAARRGGGCLPLGATDTPIHHDAPATEARGPRRIA